MNDQKNVWIDRQEYERLKTLETQTQSATSTIVVDGQVSESAPIISADSNAPEQSSVNKLTIFTAISAVVSFVFPPAILIFLGLGIASLVKFFRGRSSRGAKFGVGLVTAIAMTIFVVVAGPFLLLFGFILIWQLGCWTGLGSCTTA